MKKSFFLLPIVAFLLSCSKEPLAEIPLKEHPRPDFERSAWQNLNGYWNFAADSAAAGEKENWQDNPGSFASKILVPFSWASPLSGITMPEINIGWYARTFTLRDQEWKGKNIFIIFGASDFHTKVWLNGHLAGEHKGGYVPFEFNITSFLNKGSNQLVVRVEDEELDDRPSGKQYYGNAKGIWQTVYLEPRSDIY
jgi:beta-galactosidase/beta-glucuronidase